jgi:hypothetical protein
VNTLIVPLRVPHGPPARGRTPFPIRRQLMDAIQDFSMVATADGLAVRDVLRITTRLLEQTPPRIDLALANIAALTPRLTSIIDCGRALSGAAEIEATREEPQHAA